MPTYQIEMNGQTYEVDAPDENGLKIAIQGIQGNKTADTAMGRLVAGKPNRTHGIDDTVRTIGRGVLGIGSYLDEMDAATNATLAPLVDPMLPDSFEKLPGKTWQERYDQALKIQRRKDQQMDEDHPYLSTGLKIGGGVASGGALLKAAPAIGNYVLGNTGATLPARIGATATASGLTGAVQGFGAGEEGAKARFLQAAKEAGTGAAAGVAMMPVAAGTNKLASWIASKILGGQADDALSAMSPEARKYITKELADPNKVTTLKGELDQLGPDAMLADVSPDWLGVARGAATRPGTRSAVVDPLEARAAAANSRLRADMDVNLGEAPIPSRVNAEIGANLDETARGYGPVMADARAVDTEPLAHRLEAMTANTRGPEQRAIREVRGYLNIPGTDVLDPNPQALHATRQAIDGLLTNETNPQVIRQLTLARQEVDNILAEAAPGIKDVDAQYSELMRQRGALDQGRPILNNEASAMRPEELQQNLAEGALPQGTQIGPSAVPTRMRQSARAELDRAIGTKANDTTALRNVVRGEGDWNRAKLGILFGQDNADRALGAIDRETIFGDTANRVTRGSDTAMASRFGKFLDDTAKSKDIPTDTTAIGAGHKLAKWIAQSILQGNPDLNAARVADDIGRLSVAQGSARDDIVDALLKRGSKNVVDKARAARLKALFQSGGLAGYSMLPIPGLDPRN